MRLSIVSRVVQRPFSEIVVCFVQMGHEWKPPLAKEDSRWDSAQKHGLVRHLLEKALLYDVDRLQTIADIMEEWDDDGVAGVKVTVGELSCYVQKLKDKKLIGPRVDKKTTPPTRQIIAAIPAARLLKRRLPEIRAMFENTRHFDRPRPPTKREMAQQAERREEQLEDEIATLQVKVLSHRIIGTIVPVAQWCQCMLPAHVAPFLPFSTPSQYSMIRVVNTVCYSLHTFHRRRGPPYQGSTARTTYPVGGVFILLQDCALSGGG